MLNPMFTMSLLTTGAEADPMSQWMSYGMLALVFVGFYFLMIRPQKKREKQAEEMRKALQIGDEVIAAGGIIGRVVSIKDETVVIETGSDRSKIRVARWSVQANNSAADSTPSAPPAKTEKEKNKDK